jgi:hypothetical protein
MTTAWYAASREDFLRDSAARIADQLAGRAAQESLEILPDQATEWQRSVAVLQEHLNERIPLIRAALESDPGAEVQSVILEYDFRRRGLRMDCLLLARGLLFVVEFKRSKLSGSDREQVMRYATNLLEFHKVTRRWYESADAIVAPILALTSGRTRTRPTWPGFGEARWSSLVQRPIECDQSNLSEALQQALSHRKSLSVVALHEWLASPFSPSSSIVDAALSLYGNHDVVAIQDHAAPQAEIEDATAEIRSCIGRALADQQYHLVFLSGAPGAGKTLVGLDLVMRGPHARESVFVTGNAPLVEVLNKALGASYKAVSRSKSLLVPFGYPRRDAAAVAHSATYKIVTAHHFLGQRGSAHRQEDGRVLVFDEAQRTYKEGRLVLGQRLTKHEADLILNAQRAAYPVGGAVVVALIGHNQAINRGERGMVAWLEAADRLDWSFSVSDETLSELAPIDRARWAQHRGRSQLSKGHLHQSLRYYRNAAIEQWADAVLAADSERAREASRVLGQNGDAVLLTRSLQDARTWGRSAAIGDERVGLIASGQARRLAADGLFVELKPDIATWMLSPPSDIRSSNSLETVQNQYQIQGLELDHCIVCWDADLRRVEEEWAAYRLGGEDWRKDKELQIALNSYRVLLTRARKSMLIYVPRGDASGRDPTRDPSFYDGIALFLLRSGAKSLG